MRAVRERKARRCRQAGSPWASRYRVDAPSAIAALAQPRFQFVGHLLRRASSSLKMDIRILRRLVRRVDTGEIGDLALQRPRIQPLRIAPRAFLERRIDKHLNEFTLAHQLTGHPALGAEGRDER